MKVGYLAMSQKTNGSSNLEFILGLFLSASQANSFGSGLSGIQDP